MWGVGVGRRREGGEREGEMHVGRWVSSGVQHMALEVCHKWKVVPHRRVGSGWWEAVWRVGRSLGLCSRADRG